MLTILGPTASGKTQFAVAVARQFGGEIISADSRQVFRRMDIGTGKDLADYGVGESAVPYHLIDIAEPGETYNAYRFQQDFLRARNDIESRHRLPIICGGTGMYIESVLRNYQFEDAPQDTQNPRHKGRLPRPAEEVAARQPYTETPVFGIRISREERRKRISIRLNERLAHGMVEEVRGLLQEGVPAEKLLAYGLEYRFVTLYLQQELTWQEMHDRLEIAIHQFAKRQMTWFNGMERRGIPIHWIDYTLPMEEKLNHIYKVLESFPRIREKTKI